MFIGPFLVVYILRYLSLRDLASMSSSPSSHHHIHGIIRLGPPNKCLETETSPSHEINHICVILANRLRVINWLILPLLVYLLFLWSKYFLTYVVMLLCLLAKHSYYITSIDGYSKFTWFICLRKFWCLSSVFFNFQQLVECKFCFMIPCSQTKQSGWA
jgi:hypothetical protein